MNRRTFLKSLTLATASLITPGCSAAGRSKKPARRKPNFVFIFIDDMGYKDLACFGSKYYQTPRIDKLADQGMKFTDAYSNAPNCAPTRAALISGQYSPRHGIYTVGSSERGSAKMRKLIPTPNTRTLDTKVVTIADGLKTAGYTSACIGKWHLGSKSPYKPQDRGFDFAFDRNHGGHFDKQGNYLTDTLTAKATQFIEASKDKPFFLYLSHHAVHTPIQAKKKLIAKYTDIPGDEIHNNPKYAAMVESVDQSVGKVLDKLDVLDLTDNTVVFFFSDNGGYGNATAMAPLRGSKGMLYEGGIRVPLIIRWPGVTKPGTQCNCPVIGIDFYPTMLQIAAGKNPKDHILDGKSILPLIKGADTINRQAIFWHFPAYLEPYNEKQKPWRITPAGAVRAGDWKLIEFFEDGKLELYNLKDDISETKNLAKANPQKAKQLHNLLTDWRAKTKAPVPTERNPKYDPS